MKRMKEWKKAPKESERYSHPRNRSDFNAMWTGQHNERNTTKRKQTFFYGQTFYIRSNNKKSSPQKFRKEADQKKNSIE